MNYTKGEYCLGDACRWYNQKSDAICFKQGVLPRCSPELKQVRKKLDYSAPNMYEALKILIEETAFYSDEKCDHDVGICWCSYKGALSQSTQALAKAEGKEVK